MGVAYGQRNTICESMIENKKEIKRNRRKDENSKKCI